MSVLSIYRAVEEFVLRLLFLHTPKYLYHYSTINAGSIKNGFVFRVSTQGRMYALDLDFGYSTVSSKSSGSLVVFSGKAVEKFVRHNLFYAFGYKLFWGHYITPKIGDVEFTSVKHHVGNLVEVDDFKIMSSTSNQDQVSKVNTVRVRYCLFLLVGPAFALLMILLFGGAGFSREYYRGILESQLLIWLVFVLGLGASVIFWVREYLSFGHYKAALEAAGLVYRLPLAYRAFNVIWAWFSVGLWCLLVFCLTFIPWVWLVIRCFF